MLSFSALRCLLPKPTKPAGFAFEALGRTGSSFPTSQPTLAVIKANAISLSLQTHLQIFVIMASPPPLLAGLARARAAADAAVRLCYLSPRGCLPAAAVPYVAVPWLDDGSQHRTHRDCRSDDLAFYRSLEAAAAEDTTLGHGLKQGLGVLSQALRLYGENAVVTAFNGGKDAVVVLHLMRAALAHHREQHAPEAGARLRVIFFEQKEEFPEVAAFLKDTAERFDLEVVSYADMGFAQGIAACIAEHGSKAFVLGTRMGDPNAAGQQLFEPSSDWMPPFMRVNPVIYWSYADVWEFLRRFELPVCLLYEHGYTSLGKRTDTHPNPALLRPDGSYAPAWELKDGSLERAGRTSSKPAPPSQASAAEEAALGAADRGRARASCRRAS